MADGQPKKYKPLVPPWLLGGFVLILLTLLVLLQSSNLWKGFAVDSVSDTILLYTLSSLNFFAFIIFGFIFARSLLKLRRERRDLALGSKIKVRLLQYFFAISFLPIVAMAVFSYLFMNRALDRWFTDIPGNVIREAQRMQEQSIVDQNIKLNETARMLALTLESETITNQKLQSIIEAGNLTRLEILGADNQLLLASQKTLPLPQITELESALRLIRENKFDHAELTNGKGFDVAVAQLSGGGILVVVPDFLPEGSQVIESSLNKFEELKRKQETIRQIGLLTLGVLTFLLIFASSWTAFYIARGLTIPIKALAEGADRIARGDLAHRVNVFAEDELALLVATFNQMSAKLEENSAELSERRRYIEAVLQSLSTGVISFDGENHVTTINRAAIEILKLEDADFTKFELGKIVNEENRQILERLLNRARRIGKASEQTVLQPEYVDGSSNSMNETISVALTATALPENYATKTSGVVLVIEDLSELIAAQRASAWQEVARRMAHEIKNPLTPIQLSAERIAKRFQAQSPKSKVQSFLNVFASKTDEQKPPINDQDAKVIKEGTETILREVNSLKSMVDEFSRYARLPNAQLESESLNEIIRQAVALYEDRDAQIELNLAENLPTALIDDEQLRRVFVNLIENAAEAFDAAQTDKRIVIKTFHDAARDLIVAEVSDNGSGILPADFQKLFQPYFSTKGRGTGLGLAIVQRIISEHRGKIRAVNNPAKGAKFIVELPTNV